MLLSDKQGVFATVVVAVVNEAVGQTGAGGIVMVLEVVSLHPPAFVTISVTL